MAFTTDTWTRCTVFIPFTVVIVANCQPLQARAGTKVLQGGDIASRKQSQPVEKQQIKATQHNNNASLSWRFLNAITNELTGHVVHGTQDYSIASSSHPYYPGFQFISCYVWMCVTWKMSTNQIVALYYFPYKVTFHSQGLLYVDRGEELSLNNNNKNMI